MEAKRGAAIKRLAENVTVAPILAPSPKEKHPPIIPSVVDELNFVIRGQVTDDTGVATVLIRGEFFKVTADGRFVASNETWVWQKHGKN